MASGWANDDAVNEQINSTIEDAIARARGEIPRGESLDECEECGAPIPQARAYVFIVSRRKIYKNQLIQDIIAEVRKTASYVNYNWRDA